MAMPKIEGSPGLNQEKNSLPSRKNRLTNLGKGAKRWLGKAATPFALSLLAACGAPDVRAVGGNLPIPTVAGDSSEVNAQNTAIAGANTTSAANEASATAVAGGKIPQPEGTQIPNEIPTPEVVKNPAKCVFIKDPKICILGQPRTRPGYEDQITGIEYNDIWGTPINTKSGYFSVARDNKTEKIVGVSIDFPNGSTVNIRADDLEITNTKSREVQDNETVATVGPSGYVSFSTGADVNLQTGKVTVPQSFFENNFPEEVTGRSKKLVRGSAETKVVITKKFDEDKTPTPVPHP